MDTLIKYIETSFPINPPSWVTENFVVHECPAFILRKFKDGEGAATLIIPPQAGHSSHIADYYYRQSIIETVANNREGPVYCMEYLSCTYSRSKESLDDLVLQVNTAVDIIEGKVHLIGLCQGGWLATIYTALYQEKVISLTPIASPIDFHADDNDLFKMVKGYGYPFYEGIVNLSGGIMPGQVMLTGWKMTNPIDRYFTDYVDIWIAINDDKKLEKIKRFRTWYEHAQNLAGTWYLQAIRHLFLDNKLIKKELEILDKVVDLGAITCPVVLIAGELDDITFPGQIFALGDYISTSKKYIKKLMIPKCGHIGAFMGRNSQPYIAEAVRVLN